MPGKSKEEYLEAIYGLMEDGKAPKTGEIAREMGVRDSSVTEMLKKLDSEEYIRHKPYRGVELTKKGLKVASRVKRKHRLLERFLYDVLKLRKDRVHEQASMMEHGLSDEAADALDKLMDHPETCPDDGKPIPKAGDITPPDTLMHLAVGDHATVKELAGGSRFRSRMKSMGVTEGKKIRMVAREPLGGPVVVKVGNTRLTIGRGMASKVKVSK